MGGLEFLSARLGAVEIRFTRRTGGVSRPPYASLNLSFSVGDRPQDVAENRARVERALGLDPNHIVRCRQVHGHRTVWVDQTVAPPPEADAILTRSRGLAVAMTFADCLPVVLADPATGAFALVHAGWRGLAAGVIESALKALDPAVQRRDRALAVLGPCIGPNYAVGEEVRQAILGTRPWASAYMPSGRLDLAGCATGILVRAGLSDSSIGRSPDFTDDVRRYFSHRYEHGKTGRMMAIAWCPD